MLIDKNIIKPTYHCKMFETNIEIDEKMKDNIILALWNSITFRNYREAMLLDNKYKFCSDECIKNNLLFNCEDYLNK